MLPHISGLFTIGFLNPQSKGNPAMLLSRDQILKAKDLRTKDVPVPEWAPEGAENAGDYVVRLRMLTGKQRDAFEASTVETKGGKSKQNFANFRARLVVQCIVTEDGEQMFSTADVPALGEKSSVALSRVFNACQAMNGFSEADVEELTEGFEDGPEGASPSA
ncbi:hypothetical protein [Streptomyces sp. NPDC046925]|uniref:hypothetical protein n=1 Tax=Streptomyces sp. NPDC046925 TaxID=3155375 RepID=UPI0033DB889D